MIDYVTGRGRRVHMRDPNLRQSTVCGVHWDVMVSRNAVDREDMCHNCVATYAWRDAGGDAALPPTIVEPPTAASPAWSLMRPPTPTRTLPR